MYPIFRMFLERRRAKPMPKLAFGEVHRSSHYCLLSDIDPWMEMNNGRTLTLFDLGRIPMAERSGVITATTKRGWGITVAGASIRYRARVRLFQKIDITSAFLGWDHRFLYLQQTMWRGDVATSSTLCRWAVTSDQGIVAPEKLAREMGWPETSPDLPQYAQNWIDAEQQRPWPPLI